MNKTTTEIVRAFRNREKKTLGNSYTDGRALYLHGNKIAEFRGASLWITNAGWFSNTTKERLNGIPGVNIYQSKGKWFLNGQPWDGEWINPATGEKERDMFSAAAMVAKIGDIMGGTDEEKNKFKKRMLATVPGIEFPDDWDSLSEDEKKRRLDGAIEIGLEKNKHNEIHT